VQVLNTRSYEDSVKDDEDPLIEIFIRYDPKFEVYERKIYSVLELLGDIGGLWQSLFIIGYVGVNFIAYRIFVASLLKQIYHVKHDRSRDDDHATIRRS